MTDNLTKAQRRRTMARVRSRDTTPEMTVRRLLHAMGYRFRLHRHDLPGTPDIALVSRRVLIFVHGCFWHQHRCKRGRRMPKTNRIYWTAKLARNVERDKRVRREARRGGWRTFVIWECQTRPQSIPKLKERLRSFLES